MKLYDFLIPHSKRSEKIFYAIIGVVTFFMIIGMTYLEIDSNVYNLLPKNMTTNAEEGKVAEYSRYFSPNDNAVFMSVEWKEFNKSTFNNLYNFVKDIEDIEVNGDKYVDSLISPFNAIYFKKAGETFFPKTLFSKSQSNQTLSKILKDVEGNRFIYGTVMAYDEKSVGVIVKMNKNAKADLRNSNTIYHYIGRNFFGKNYKDQKIDKSTFCGELAKVAKRYEKDFTIHIAGVPVYEYKSKQYMVRDIMTLLIPAIIMMIIILFLNFKSVRGVVLPILCMILSMIWTMGLMGYFRYKLTVVGILIPPLIMLIGSSYTLHYINSYYLNSIGADKRNIIINATNAIFPTIFLASVTTVIGFASFLTARMDVIRNFGIWICVSIALTLFFSFFLLSKILFRLPIPTNVRVEKVSNDVFSKTLNFLNMLVFKFKYVFVLIFVACIVLFSVTIGNLRVETNATNFFKSGDKVKKDMSFLQKNYKGTISFNIVIKSKNNEKDFFRTRAGLLSAKKIQDFVQDSTKIDGVQLTGWTFSALTLIEDINYSFNGKHDVPEDQEVINKLFNLLLSSKDSNTRTLVKDDLSMMNIQVRTYSDRPKLNYVVTEQELIKLNKYLNENLKRIAAEDGTIEVETWGDILHLAGISKYLKEDQIGSLSFTLLFIVITALLLFRSLYFSIFSLIPLIFGVFMNFTIMSVLGIPLDAATIMIGAISMGVGIDNAIHFILGYRKILKRGVPYKEAIDLTLKEAGRPIMFTSLALIAGFMVFLLSTFCPVYYFGVLIAVSMFNCTFAALMILPSFFLISDKLRTIFVFKKKV